MKNITGTLFLVLFLFTAGMVFAAPLMVTYHDYTWNMAEEFVLLSLNSETGKISAKATHSEFGLAGALIYELRQQGALSVHQGKVQLVADVATGEPCLDFCRDMIARAKKEHNLNYWIRRIARHDRKLRSLILEKLAASGIVEAVAYRPFLGHRRCRYPLREESVKKELLQRCHDFILQGQPSGRETTLASVLYACDLHKKMFSSKDEYRVAKRTLKSWVKGDEIGKSVLHKVKDAQAIDYLLFINQIVFNL